MFDITSTKLLILGVVALLVVGPQELPGLLRTLGKYMGMIKRQAAEFRAQFDEAMRETELAELKKEIETIGKDAESTMRDAQQTIETHVGDIKTSVDTATGDMKRELDAAAADVAVQEPKTLTEAQAVAHEPAIETTGTEAVNSTPAPAVAPVAPELEPSHAQPKSGA